MPSGWLFKFVVVVLILGTPSLAGAETQRSGFTLQLGTGVGTFASVQRDGDNVFESAVSPLSLGIGFFLNRRFALVAQTSTTLFRYTPSGVAPTPMSSISKLTRSHYLGLGAQLWLSDSWSLGAGVGVSLLGNGPIQAQLNRGMAFPVRLSRRVGMAAGGQFSLFLELLPSFYSRTETTLGSTFGLEWQYL